MGIPIAQDLNSDILFIIFTDYEIATSLYMLQISAVCRHWYNVALSTPQAWARISMDISVRPGYMETYLKRSGNVPLHISVNETITEGNWGLLVQQKGRIRCLNIRGCYRFLQLSIFPILEKLILRAHTENAKNDMLEPMSVSLLEVSRFPLLRSVEMIDIPNSLVDAIKPREAFPQLQKLSSTLQEKYPLGYQIITSTAEILVSLTLHIRSGDFRPINLGTIHLPLPQLRYFRIFDCDSGSKTTITLVSPRLESVQHLIAHRQSTLLAGDAHKAIYLLTNSMNMIPSYPNIRTVWLENKATDFWVNGIITPDRQRVASALAGKISSCPKLEGIHVIGPLSKGSLNLLQSAIDGTGVSLSVTKHPRACFPGFKVSIFIRFSELELKSLIAREIE
jgi:hypothetical protein